MKKRVSNSTRRIKTKNKNLLLWLIGIIILAFIIYFIVKLFTSNITGNAVITGDAVSDNLVIYAKAVKSSYGTKCNSPKTNVSSFYIGKTSKKDYSGTSEFDISSLSGKKIQTSEICFSKSNTNTVDFEIKLIAEDSLKCPSDLSGQIISTKTFTDKFVNGKYFCFDVKDYVVNSLVSGKNSLFITISGKRVSKSGSDYITLFGLDKKNKYTPYLKYESVPCSPNCNGKSCGDDKCGGSCGTCPDYFLCNDQGACVKGCKPNWQCSDWSACSNGKQTRTCNDANNCGISDGKPALSKVCSTGIRTIPDSVGMFTIPVSNFFLKNTLAGDVSNALSFSFKKEPVNSNSVYGCIKSSSTGECMYVIPDKSKICQYNDSLRRSYFYAGARYGSQVPLIGDWDGDGIDSVGIYDPINGIFLLKNKNSAGNEDIKFKFGKTAYEQFNSEYQYAFSKLVQYYYPLQYPVVGDWDGDGIDSVGLYDPFTSTFNLRNTNSEGNADISFKFVGNPAQGNLYFIYYLSAKTSPLCPKSESAPEFYNIPVVGDWDGDGKDTVGLYDLSGDSFFLTNELKENLNPGSIFTTKFNLNGILQNQLSNYYRICYTSFGGLTCSFNHDRIPLSGDWDGDGADEIGIYSQASNLFYMKNDFSTKSESFIGEDFIVNGLNGLTDNDSKQTAYDNDRYQYLNFKIPLSGHWSNAKSNEKCVPNCENSDGTNKECGDNGCGGFCGNFGNCANGDVCQNSKCVQCVPKTCSDLKNEGKECGILEDGCGGSLICQCANNFKCRDSDKKCINVGVPINVFAGKNISDGYIYLDKAYDINNITVEFLSCSNKYEGCRIGISLYPLGNLYTNGYQTNWYGPDYNLGSVCDTKKCFSSAFYSYKSSKIVSSAENVVKVSMASYTGKIKSFSAYGTPSI